MYEEDMLIGSYHGDIYIPWAQMDHCCLLFYYLLYLNVYKIWCLFSLILFIYLFFISSYLVLPVLCSQTTPDVARVLLTASH